LSDPKPRTEILGNEQMEQMLHEHLRFEHLLAEISAMFIRLAYGQVDAVIETALKKVLDFFQMDRCGLARVSRRDMTYSITHFAFGPDISPVRTNTEIPITSTFPYVYRKVIEQNEIVSFLNLDEMPAEASVDKQTYQAMQVRSALIIPVSLGGASDYLISINSVRKERLWPVNLTSRLRLLGELFSLAIERRQAQQKLEKELNFKKFLSLLAARFIQLPEQDIDDEIESALRGFVECLDFSRVVLAQLSQDQSRIELTYYWVRPGSPAPLPEVPVQAIPWIITSIRQGRPAVISNIDELSPGADSDRVFLATLGIKSGVFLPLKSKGETIGFLSFLDLRAKRDFSAELIENLQLAADILANTLSRQRADQAVKRNILEIQRLKELLEQENLYLREEVELQVSHRTIVCESAAMKRVLAQVEQVAPTDSTVLIQGETGTGKELMARTIHALSARKERPLVTVNCASLSPTLIESDLFGREKGAYTGALTRMAGRFEIADKSTLFLDEIGELPFDVQSKLLRVLEEGQFERLGSTRSICVNVRIIAATNRDLSREVDAGKFRKDLYYRLCVFPILIPPLRERLEDIPPLAWAFVKHYRGVMAKSIDHIPRKSMEALRRYPWPGNVRELRNIIEHAIIVSRGKSLEPVLPQIECGTTREDHGHLDDFERQHIVGVLKKCGWRITGAGGAAEALGLKRTTLQSKMKKLGITRRPPG